MSRAMLPVLSLDQVRVAWVVLEKEGFLLYGFLLYTGSDRALVDYMKEGIYDLDILSGEKCAVFVLESPSREWVTYTRQSDHSWWRLFGADVAKQIDTEGGASAKRRSLFEKTIIENIHNSVIVVGQDNVVSLSQILDPPINLPYNRAEALKVARHFGLGARDVPCLVFFRSLSGSVISKVSLEEFNSQDQLKRFFRDFFEGADFESLLTLEMAG
jgi:hypothetical protein